MRLEIGGQPDHHGIPQPQLRDDLGNGPSGVAVGDGAIAVGGCDDRRVVDAVAGEVRLVPVDVADNALKGSPQRIGYPLVPSSGDRASWGRLA